MDDYSTRSKLRRVKFFSEDSFMDFLLIDLQIDTGDIDARSFGWPSSAGGLFASASFRKTFIHNTNALLSLRRRAMGSNVDWIEVSPVE